jgi:hypothetical protein
VSDTDRDGNGLLPIGTLEPGQRFQLAAIPERQGVLVRLGAGAAVVRYGEPRHIALPNGRAFEATPRDVTISLETNVIPLLEPAAPAGAPG